MLCPHCNAREDRVVDSREVRDGRAIRRRRVCNACQGRFTTYETIEEMTLLVVKTDGRREPFDRGKILKGLILACKKRPIALRQMEALAERVEAMLQSLGSREIQSQLVGELVMKELQELDEVAYVRFASVYRRFQDSRAFLEQIREFSPSRVP